MKYQYHSTQILAGFLIGACLLFFVLFALYFYMVEQRDVIALTHFIKSEGDTSEHRLVPAMLGMVLSVLPAVVLLKLFNFNLRMKAAALLPSYVLLGLLSATAPVETGSNVLHTPMFAAFLLMALSILVVCAAVMFRDERSEHRPVQCYLVWNVLLTVAGVLFCVSLTANGRELHEQLALERIASQDKWPAVMRRAVDPTCQNRNITAVHALALSKTGQLADELFTIPGLKGSESLLPDTSAAVRMFGIDRSLYGWLGVAPARECKMSASVFLKMALDHRLQPTDSISTVRDSLKTRVLVDYYLCSLLLDRKLADFVRELPRFYAINDSLPRHYREGYIMYQRRAKVVEHPLLDEATTTSFQDFLNIMTVNKKNKDMQRQACMDMYDGTYWTYMLIK